MSPVRFGPLTVEERKMSFTLEQITAIAITLAEEGYGRYSIVGIIKRAEKIMEIDIQEKVEVMSLDIDREED